MKMTNKLKFGLVGTGGIAQAYAQAFKTCETAQLVAVADVRVEAARALAEEMRCDSFASYEEMAAGAQLDAVVICTPPVTHPEICHFFLKRKINVLCEKPFSIDAASARLMCETAKECGVTLTMASKFRYVEDVARAKSMVASGMFGDVILFENSFTSRVEMSSRWNSNASISGGGVLIDNGAHSVDLMRYFLGPLAEVQVVEGKRSQNLDVEETVHIFARSVSGIMGNIDLSWSINKEQENYISIYGSRGTIKLGWKESKYRHANSPDWVVFGQGYDKVAAFRRQLENFSRALNGDEQLLITSDDGLASVEVIEAAYASLRQSQWTAVARDANTNESAGSREVIYEAGNVV
jgi:predicted dehydrogenase